MNIQEFATEWEKAFDVREEILNADSIETVEEIFKHGKLHPLSLYGRLDFALINRETDVVMDCMNKVLKFIHEPFPNPYFDLPSNDPIGEIMLKPLIQHPLKISPVGDPNVQNYLQWILVGYVYLFRCFIKQGIEAYDSLRTMGAVVEQNSDDFAAIIFGYYINLSDYSGAYTKFLIFTFLSAGLGFQKHGGNNDEFFKLTGEAKRYAEWLNERDSRKELSQLFDEGKEVANVLYHKVLNDIKNKEINLQNLTPPKLL